MKRMMALLFALGLLLSATACGESSWDDSTYLKLYYPADLEQSRGSDAIAHMNIPWDDMAQADVQAQADQVMALLMGACHEEGFTVPVPHGARLQQCEIRNGIAYVDFSEAYGMLSGMELTIADYCVALSLTQIRGVDTVSITVGGRELAYRDSQRFTAKDALFTSTDEPVRTLNAWLYFPDAQGQLTGERHELTLYEGQVRCGVVMDALMTGPEDETLLPLLPDGFAVLTVRLEGGVCYLNLPSSDIPLLPQESASQELMMQGIVRSLCAISGVHQVQILQDGMLLPRFGQLDVSQPLTPKN